MANRENEQFHKKVLKDVQHRQSKRKKALNAIQGKKPTKAKSRDEYHRTEDVKTIEERRKERQKRRKK